MLLLFRSNTGGAVMAVRAFTAAHALNTATGALATSTFGTQAIIVKRGATGSWHTFLAFHNSGGTALSQFAYDSGNLAAWWIDGITVTGPAAIGTTAWGLVVVRKASGTATPRFSLYNFTTATWTHANASGTRSNWTAPGASGQVRFNWEGSDQFVGRVAVRAAWNTVKWAADTTGDAALEAAGLEDSLQNWVDADPDALWPFNQAATTTAVTDITGGGADQVSITGTTVVTGDDPPGFSFDLGGGTTGTVAVTQAAQASSTSGQLGYSGTSARTQAANTSSATGTVSGPVTGTAAAAQANQTSTATGQLGYSGTATPTQAPNTSAAVGKLGYSGTTAATQAPQTSSATGQLGYSGTAARTQANQTASASGIFTAGGAIAGSVAVTQANQTAAATGHLGYSGTATVSQANHAANGTGKLGYSGTTAASQAPSTATAAGTVTAPVAGTVAASQANQTPTAIGILRYTGTVTLSQGSNVVSIQGIFFIPITGTVAEAQANQTASAAGSALGDIVERPNIGTTNRPGSGITARPFAGVTPRP